MNPIEIMALLIALLSGIKLIVIMINQKAWLNFWKPIYRKSGITTIVALVIGAVSLNYLMQVMSIVHLFAAMLFFTAMMLLSFMAYSKETLAFAEQIYKKKNLLARAWLPTIVWVILLVWVFYTLFV